MRDKLEARFPKLVGIYDWPRYRFLDRCIICGRLNVVHSPWAFYICQRTPMSIVITDQGRERIAASTEGQGEDLRTVQAV